MRACLLLSSLLVLGPPRAAAQFPAELRGRVLDARSRAPIAAARVEAVGADRALTTDADGRFLVRGLPPGRWEIRVGAIGYRPAAIVADVDDGHSASIEIALAPAVTRLAEVEVRVDEPASPTATVLDRAAIQHARARDLGELLEGQAGLTVTRRGGPGAPATVSIRGSTPNQVLVLVDGVPLNDPVTGEADLSSILPELVERVVVLRGTQAARHGAQALAGAVLVETRRPDDAHLTLGLVAGAWGERGAHAAGAAGPALLSLGYARTAGDFRFAVPAVRGGGDATRSNCDSERLDGLAAARFERGAWSVRGRLDGHDLERGMPGSIVQPSLAARQERDRLGGGVQVVRAGARTDHRLDLSLQRQRARYADPAPPLGPAYDDSLWTRHVAVALSSSVTFRNGAMTLGGELRRLDLRASALVAPPARQHARGAWAQMRIAHQAPVGRWEVSGGVRADRDDLADRTYLSPKIGTTLTRGRAAAHLSWGQAFAPPSLADQFFQDGVRARANPDLRPERVRGEIEGGVNVGGLTLFGATVDAGATAFRADVDGMILWFPNFQFVWSPDNYDVRRTGVELTTRVRAPSGAVELSGSVSHVAVTYAAPALRGQVAYRPRFAASAALRAALVSVRLLANYRHVGERRTVPGSALNTLPPFGMLDLHLSRPVSIGGWNAELAVAIDNVLDRDATMLVDYPEPGRSWRLGVQLTPGD